MVHLGHAQTEPPHIPELGLCACLCSSLTLSLKEPDAPRSESRGRGEEMPARRKLHGDINALLNPMVRDGLISRKPYHWPE